MLELNLPKFETHIDKIEDIFYIWDNLRKKKLVLTPEEWVRQHFVNYLINYLKYPKSRIANEIELELNKLKKRCDTIIYNQYIEPVMILEYKAPNIALNQKTIDQILRYNIILKVNYLVISNGISHYCFKINRENNDYEYLDKIPMYKEIIL